jgi:hypothetical protein
MPKPRAKLTPLEEAIVSKGGEPGTAARVEPIRKNDPAQQVAAPAPPASQKGVYRPTMVRFTPEDFSAVEQAVKDFVATRRMKVSLNAWIVSACMEKIERDKT